VFTVAGLLWLGPSPYRHNRYPFTPIWGNRRGRDGLPYGLIRGLRDIKSLGVPQTLKEIRTEVMATSKAFGVDAQDSIRSYYDAISSGVDPRSVKQFVETAVMLKDVAQGDLPTALDVLTSAVNAYRKSVDDVDDIADQLAFTVNKGKVTLSQMKSKGVLVNVERGVWGLAA